MEDLRERNKLLEEDLARRTTPWRKSLTEHELYHLTLYHRLFDKEMLGGYVGDCAKLVLKLAGLLDEIQGAPMTEDTKSAERPGCPYCLERMVRTHYQNEEGDWFVCWMCGCEPDPEIIERE